ncbi:MAG: hypothetical protein ACRD0G_10870 [Acidimicrobiales bacterium]
MRNLLAADGGELQRAGKRYVLHRPHVTTASEADDLPVAACLAGRLVRDVLTAELEPAPRVRR